jgi:hypothetical protein
MCPWSDLIYFLEFQSPIELPPADRPRDRLKCVFRCAEQDRLGGELQFYFDLLCKVGAF